MVNRQCIPANLGTHVAGPAMTATRRSPSAPQQLGVVPAVAASSLDDPSGLVADAVARATLLSCLAWGEGAMLPLRLAALAWRRSSPRATSLPALQPTSKRQV